MTEKLQEKFGLPATRLVGLAIRQMAEREGIKIEKQQQPDAKQPEMAAA